MTFHKTLSLRVLFALVAVLTFVGGVFAADAPHARPLKCVYFVPSDCQPYPDRAQRLYRVMSCVQNFYRSEMERNGFGPMSFGLEEEKPGELKLYYVSAPEKQEFYGRNSAGAVRDVVAKALAKEGIDVNNEVVVIFQIGLRWEGKKAVEVSSFVGGGSPFHGTAWFYDDPMLDPDKLSSKEPGGYYNRPCSVGEFNTHYIGGIAHELGHALTLPHDCELSTDISELGRALMGAGNHTFGEEKRGEGKGAFLTYAEALRLSVVPAISGKEPVRRANDVKLVELKAKRASKTSVTFSGKIESGSPILGLIFYEDRNSHASDYDAKTWVVKPNERGEFEILLTEVAPEPSQLRVSAVRDVDTVQIGQFDYNPDGSANEFAPIERTFQMQKLAAAFGARDVDAMRALSKGEFADSPEMKSLCDALVKSLVEPVALVSPADAEGDSFDLSDAKFETETVGWAKLGRRAFFDGRILTLGGVGYASGLSAHAPSALTCDLGGKWKTLSFGYGLQDGAYGAADFTVVADGKTIFQSETMRATGPKFAKLDVSGVKKLELVTGNGDDGGNSDHTDWIAPTLER